MMHEPTLLTVILNYKTPCMTLRALSSALQAMDGIKGAITIVDNDSQDGSYEKIAKVIQARLDVPNDRVRVIQSGHNGGFGAGNNVGIRARLPNGDTPDYVYILNSDAFPKQDAIKLLMAHLQDNPKVGFAGSYIHGETGEPHHTAFRFPSIKSEFEGAAQFGPISRLLKNHIIALPQPDQTRIVDWLAGASLMMRQSVLDEIGLFDEKFFLYFEETDLCRRAQNAGWSTVYVRESEVAHIGSVSTGMKTWDRMPNYWFNSRLYYFTKNHGGLYAASATLVHLMGGAINAFRRLFQNRPKSSPAYFMYDLTTHFIRSVLNSMDQKHSDKLTSTAPISRQDIT